MNRAGNVLFYKQLAGIIFEDEDGYHFQYDSDYLKQEKAQAVSLTLPLQEKAFHEQVLFPFFDGLIPEGWLMEIAVENWKVNPRDRMGLLLSTCRDCIGAVSIIPQTIEAI
ncbi:HipA N-terminal domain-containing protein [Emticicia fontis]